MARGGRRVGAGRPAGVPNKVTASVKEAAQEHTEDAVATLAEIMGDKTQPAAARVSAANAILDRGYGKPSQALNLGGSLTVKGLADFYSDQGGDEAESEGDT